MKIDGDTNEILEYLVIDTGAVLRGESYSFLNIAKTICTITEVLNEIRDSKSRQLLEKLPYKIEIMTPSDKALKEVVAFCRKTGDFNALSLTDIKLIALVYTLESSLFSDSHLLQRSKVYFR
jgi:RNA-binding protein NOB1